MEAAKFGHDFGRATKLWLWYLNIMSQPSGKLYVPPFSGVRLIECREHFQLVPVPAMKVMHGYGKIKASQATIDPDDPKAKPIWDDLRPDRSEEHTCELQSRQYLVCRL